MQFKSMAKSVFSKFDVCIVNFRTDMFRKYISVVVISALLTEQIGAYGASILTATAILPILF